MRSSKSRSRSKSNRPRTLGNITNRVFDSSGPEGKVRGTPQQIIEKFGHLARDAQLSNDRVAAENFLQHAEHYTRMLGEAQREMQAEQDARRDSGQNQPRERSDQNGDDGYSRPENGNGGRYDNQRQDSQRSDTQRADNQRSDNGDQRRNVRSDGGPDAPRADRKEDRREDRREDRKDDRREDRDRRPDPRATEQPRGGDNPVDVIDLAGTDDDAGLVETPEARRPVKQRQHRDPKPKSQGADAFDGAPPSFLQSPQEIPEAAEAPAKPERAPRRPRAPRKPKEEGSDVKGDTSLDNGPSEAAE